MVNPVLCKGSNVPSGVCTSVAIQQMLTLLLSLYFFSVRGKWGKQEARDNKITKKEGEK